MTTVLDLIKEEGIQEGIQMGIQMGRDETITRLLRHSSLSPQEIASILEVDLSRVLSLAGESLSSSNALSKTLNSSQRRTDRES